MLRSLGPIRWKRNASINAIFDAHSTQATWSATASVAADHSSRSLQLVIQSSFLALWSLCKPYTQNCSPYKPAVRPPVHRPPSVRPFRSSPYVLLITDQLRRVHRRNSAARERQTNDVRRSVMCWWHRVDLLSWRHSHVTVRDTQPRSLSGIIQFLGDSGRRFGNLLLSVSVSTDLQLDSRDRLWLDVYHSLVINRFADDSHDVTDDSTSTWRDGWRHRNCYSAASRIIPLSSAI